MPWRMDCNDGLAGRPRIHASQINQIDYLAEIILLIIVKTHRLYAGLSLMVWILKREVRAFGGCLGMYRR
jgi:hypothetical protein